MELDSEVLEIIVKGLNGLEGGRFTDFSLSGLTVVEAIDIKEKYLSSYNINMLHSQKLEEGYILNVAKKVN